MNSITSIRAILLAFTTACAGWTTFIGYSCPLFVSTTGGRDSSALVELQRTIDNVIARDDLRKLVTAVEVSETADTSILYARNSGLLLRVASLTKLVTSAAALRAFPAEAAFRTVISAAIDPGGAAHVVLEGCGDPFIDLQDIDSISDMLCTAGVRRIHSLALRGVPSDSIAFGRGWMWDDEDASFTPQVNSFMVGDGVWTLRITADSARTRIRVSPDVGACRVVNRLTTGRQTRFTARRLRDVNTIIVEGMIAQGAEEKAEISMARPREVFRTTLLRSLRSRRLLGHGAPSSAEPKRGTLRVIGEISHPVIDAIDAMNTVSDNRCAETVLRLLGRRAGNADPEQGLAAIRGILDSAGVPVADLEQADGSGLSHYNLTSAAMLGALLRIMAHPADSARFLASLARPGARGTLRSRLEGVTGARRVHAKTGTMTGISGLAGYVEREQGGPLAFVIMMQNYSGSSAPYRAAQDAIVTALLAYAARTSRFTLSR